MRGVSVDELTSSEAAGNSNGGSVATYVGEIPVYIDLVPKDLARVEVLRGPQGTLYGAGSLAGAVRYIPVRPSTEAFSLDLGGKAYSIAESDDGSYDVDATINLPLGDRLAFRGLVGRRRLAVGSGAGEADERQAGAERGEVPDGDSQTAGITAGITAAITAAIAAAVFDSERDKQESDLESIVEHRPPRGNEGRGADEEARRVSIVARVPEALVSKGLKAGDWVREAATACGGRGGGRPDMAQAGGPDGAAAEAALSAIEQQLAAL